MILEKKLAQQFQDFVNTPEQSVPTHLSQQILKNHESQLKKDILRVAVKLLTIHGVTSTLSLFICHQFDMNPFNSSVSLSDYFMRFGHSTCMFFCGFLFIGLSLIMARSLLNSYDFQWIKRTFILQFLVLSTLSVGIFMLLGAQTTLTMISVWVLGGLLGSVLGVFTPNLNTISLTPT